MKFTLGLKELPFEQLRTQIIYTEGHYDTAVNEFIRTNYKRIRRYCEDQGYEFCYMPLLSEELRSSESLFYNAPYAKMKEEAMSISNDFILNFMTHPENKEQVPPSLLYVMPTSYYGEEEIVDNACLYKGLVLEPYVTEPFEDAFFRILSRIMWSLKETSKSEECDCRRASADRISKWFKDGAFDFVEEEKATAVTREQEEEYQSQAIADLQFNREMARVADEIYERIKLLEKKGISRFVLEQYIIGKEKLSRLHITKDFRIFLPDYDNVEITMTPLPKAVYLLFLRHPEGIQFSYLPDYRQELMDIYQTLKPTAISTASQASIDKVTDPTDNSINEKCSRIKEAFIKHFEERLAQNYFVTGAWGEPKRIKLPRELVEWEK